MTSTRKVSNVNISLIYLRRHNCLSVMTMIHRRWVVLAGQVSFQQAAELMNWCCIPDCDGRFFQICGAATRKSRAAVACLLMGLIIKHFVLTADIEQANRKNKDAENLKCYRKTVFRWLRIIVNENVLPFVNYVLIILNLSMIDCSNSVQPAELFTHDLRLGL